MRFLLLVYLTITAFIGQAQNEINGFWLTEDGSMIVNIFNQGSVYTGEVYWLKDSVDQFGPIRDVMNPEPRNRSRKILGLNILNNFEFNNGIWRGGRIYNHKNGNLYNGKISLKDEDRLELTGYYGILFFLGKTKTWSRVNPKSFK